PFATLLTAAVIGIALAMPAALNLLVKNGRDLAGGLDNTRDFSVYLTMGTSLERARKLAADVQMETSIYSVTVTDADTALEEFRVTSGFDDVLEEIDGNPLPHTLNVTPVDEVAAADLAALRDKLLENDAIDSVQIDTAWVERLNAILDFLRRIVIVATIILIIGAVIIVGNTIRLDINNRRDEIEVLKLLGASDGFVRRPFLYVGLWYGLAGSLLALLLLLIGGWVLSGPVDRLLGLYDSDTAVLGLDGLTLGLLLAGGVIAGWGGAWSAVARHLSAIQPK
ncbi:MAG: FtsX-like permease family protein, partial [Gammaproteobacteria bacterium]|nr:FtsX-like permease family protein [Gammaproteobacteria bacterium]